MSIEDGQIGANGYPEWQKDPDGPGVEYGIDWSAWLAKRGIVNLATSTWIVPAGLVKVSESNTATVGSVVISGGTRGKRYQVVNRITVSGAKGEDQTIELFIRNK